jgi:hypothetical protein
MRTAQVLGVPTPARIDRRPAVQVTDPPARIDVPAPAD